MDAKKTLSANLETQRSTFLLFGFVLVLGFMYISLEWSKNYVPVFNHMPTEIFAETEDLIPQTFREEPPAPPQAPEPIVPPKLTITNATVETNTTVFINNPDEPITLPQAPIIKVQTKDIDVETPIYIPEIYPEFPGGKQELYKFLGKNITYPSGAKEAGIKGRVVCQFTINKDGSIVDIEVLKGVDPALDEEAVRVIKMMPKWNPGQQAGKNVRVRYTLPILFTIQES